MSVRKLVRTLRPLRDVVINVGGKQFTVITPPDGDAVKILDSFKRLSAEY